MAVEKYPLAVGISAFLVHVSSAARVMEAIPFAKINTIKITFFTILSFTNFIYAHIFPVDLISTKKSLFEFHRDFLLQKAKELLASVQRSKINSWNVLSSKPYCDYSVTDSHNTVKKKLFNKVMLAKKHLFPELKNTLIFRVE